MTSPEGKGPLQAVLLGGAALATLALIAAVIAGPDDGVASGGTSSATPSRPSPRMQMKQRAEGALPRAGIERAAEDPSTTDQPATALPLLAQLKNSPLKDRVQQLRQSPAVERAMADGRQPADLPPASAPPSPTAETATVSRESVQAAVREVLPALQRCYESSLKMKADSRGVVRVAFTLQASDGGGSLKDAEILDSDLANPVADACLLDVVAAAHFPIPEGKGEVRVTYPFRLESGDTPGNAPASP